MATCNVLETEITNLDYINFLKVGHALSQFQKGIRPFITRKLQAIHETILANIGGKRCDKCTTDNILLHPKRKCRKSGCVCWDDPQYSRRPCPTGYCKQFYDELVQRNRYGTPQMKNVDISKMSRDYWQIAKCFLSPLRSSTITSAYDCDATALCSIIINCKQFEYILGIVVNRHGGQPQDVFSQVKSIRNETMHSAVLEVAGQDMNTKLDTIVLALQCGPLIQDADAKRAANEIMKMKNSTFKVSRQVEKDVIEEKLKTMEETIGAKVKQMADNIDAKEKAIEETVDGKIKATEKTVDVKMEALEEMVDVKVNTIEATVDTKVKAVEKSVDDKQKASDTFLANQQRDIDKLRETKVKLQNRLAVVETEVVNLKQQVGEMKNEADDQRDTLREHGSMISKHACDIHKISEKNEIMGAHLPKIMGTFERLKKSLAFKDIHKRKIDKLHEHVSSIGKQFAGLRRRMKTQENKELSRLIGLTTSDLKAHNERLMSESLTANTRLSNYLLQQLKQKQVLILTGKAGTGKTFQGYNILTLLSEASEYKTVIVNGVQEIQSILPSEEPLCIFVNDIFGQLTLNKDKLIEWNQNIERYFVYAQSGKCLFIFTINSVHMEQCSNEPVHQTLQAYSIDLDNNGLNSSEKWQMLEDFDISDTNHDLRKSITNEISLPLGFPLLCKLARGQSDEMVKDLIKENLQGAISKMEPRLFISLLMVLICGGKLHVASLIGNACMYTREQECFTEVKTHYESSKVDNAVFESAVRSLVGSYLLESADGQFEFVHHAVLEATFKTAIAHNLRFIIVRYCHLETLVKLGIYLEQFVQDEQLMNQILIHLDNTAIMSIPELSQFPLWTNNQFQHQMLRFFEDRMHVFTESNGNDKSLFVTFCRLGLFSLVQKILQSTHTIQTEHMNTQRELALLESCSHGRLQCVELLLNQFDMHVTDEHMFGCIGSGNDELFALLIAKGGNIKATKVSEGINLIHEACTHNNTSLVGIILDGLSRLDRLELLSLTDLKTGDTPLCIASKHCDIEMVKLLLKNGSETDVKDIYGRNILHLALMQGTDFMVMFLGKEFPHLVQERSVRGETCVYLAAKRGNIEYVKSFIDLGVNPMLGTTAEETVLHAVAKEGHTTLLKHICKTYPDLIKRTTNGHYTAAHLAAAGGHLDCLKILIEYGIDPMCRTSKQQTLLHLAAFNGNHTILNFLCKSYADMIKHTSENQYTAAHAAAAGGHLDCLQTLIDYGIDPFCRKSQQNTILHLAALSGKNTVLDFLCKSYPGMIHLKAENQLNAADAAAGGGHLDCLQTLIDYGIDPICRTSEQDTLLHMAAFNGKHTVLDFLCKSYPDMIHLTAENQFNAAHAAAAGGHLDCLQTLIGYGIDPMCRASDQETLLHMAAFNGKHAVLDFLCKSYPGMIHLTTKDQLNPAQIAAGGGHLDCLQTLIDYGIDPICRTSEQNTLLHMAAFNGKHTVLDFLCKSYPDMIHLTAENQHNAAHAAAAGGHLDCLQTLIGYGIDPMCRASDQETLLHMAAFYGKHTVLDFLCKSYPDMIHLTAENQFNAAHFAAAGGHLDCLQTLIGKGIDPICRTSEQNTILHMAAFNGKHTVLDFLCKSYPGMIHLTTGNQCNAAHLAAAGGHLDCLQTLIGKGIDPMCRTSLQQTLLNLAAYNGKHTVLDFICKSYPDMVQHTAEDQYNAAHLAAAGGHLDCLRTLIGKGIDPMCRTSQQWTLLHMAAFNGKQTVLDFLCKSYPDMVQNTDENQCNAAHLAAAGGHLDCLRTLIGKGIDPMCRTSQQQTLLHLAAYHGKHMVLDFLCKSYPDMVQNTDENQYNAAHLAAGKGHLDCLQTLIGKGIDPMCRTSKQKTLLHLAAYQGKHMVLDFLCKSYPDMVQNTDENQYNAAHLAAANGYLDCLQTLIGKGIYPLCRTSMQETLLHLAALNGKHTVLDFLCKSYPDMVHHTADSQHNAAHLAAIKGHLDCLQTLIGKGIDPMCRTSMQETLLHLAALNGKHTVLDFLCKSYPNMVHHTADSQHNAAHLAAIKGHLDCLQTLIGKGIDPMCRTSQQQTLLHMAAYNGKQTVLDFLCKSYPDMVQNTDESQCNAAHFAAAGGHLDCLQTLIGKGIDPMCRTSHQETLLNLAAYHGKQTVLDFLCKSYPDMVQHTAVNQHNVAHAAAAGGHLDCLRTLIGKGIDPMCRTSIQETLLHLAALNGKHTVLDFLCKSYPDMVQHTAVNQHNAAHAAAAGGNLDCLRTLIGKGIDPMCRTSQQQTLLHMAAYNGKQTVLDFLCKLYPDMVQHTAENQYNAAHAAAAGGNLDCLRTLIGKGIDPMCRTSQQQTLLHMAAYKGKQTVLDFLCKSYPDMVQTTDERQANAAHYAVAGGHLDCLQTLIDYGTPRQNSFNITLLHAAAFNGHHNIVKYLCKHFPSMIPLKDYRQRDAAYAAATEHHLDCLLTIIVEWFRYNNIIDSSMFVNK